MQDRRSFVLGGLSLVVTALPAEASVGVADLVYHYSNQARRQHSRRPFKRSAKLEQAAHNYARVLARTGVFSHTADGTTLKYRVKKTGYRGGYMAENAAYRPTNLSPEGIAQKFVNGWLQSRGHRKNLLHPKLTELGVGIAQTKSGRMYAVQVFGGH